MHQHLALKSTNVALGHSIAAAIAALSHRAADIPAACCGLAREHAPRMVNGAIPIRKGTCIACLETHSLLPASARHTISPPEGTVTENTLRRYKSPPILSTDASQKTIDGVSVVVATATLCAIDLTEHNNTAHNNRRR